LDKIDVNFMFLFEYNGIKQKFKPFNACYIGILSNSPTNKCLRIWKIVIIVYIDYFMNKIVNSIYYNWNYIVLSIDSPIVNWALSYRRLPYCINSKDWQNFAVYRLFGIVYRLFQIVFRRPLSLSIGRDWIVYRSFSICL
jgi:hypothetical protein